jgi:small subunit ribosomal protein S13e
MLSEADYAQIADSKFRLILIQSHIHRLARYYRTKGQLAPTFKYEAASASTVIA